MKRASAIVLILALAVSAYAEPGPRRMSDREIADMKSEAAKTPVNTFRFLGNALVCKSDSATDESACLRIGSLKIGAEYKPTSKPWKEVPVKNGVTVSVFSIIAKDDITAYWVIGHKDGRITSIQLTGNYSNENLSFSTIMLNDSKDKVKKVLGPRYRESDVDSIKGAMWDYYPFPISIEFTNDRVYSIRIAESTSSQ